MSTRKTPTKHSPYNLSVVAQLLGKSTSTIFGWLESGELSEFPTHGNQRMVTAASVRRMARKLGVDLDGVA